MTTSLPSRGTLGWLGAVLAGGLSAAAFGFAFAYADTMLVFLAYVAGVPLFVAGLGAGFLPGVLSALIGTAAIFMKTSLALTNGYFIFMKAALALTIGYFIAFAFPAVVLTVLALRYKMGEDKKIYWYPEGYLLTVAVLYPCLVFLAAAGMASGQEGGLLGQTSQILQGAMGSYAQTMEPDMATNFKTMLEFLPRIVPAMLGCTWLVLMLASAFAAQSILKQQNWNLRGSFAWRNLEVPNALLLAAAVTGLAGVFGPAPFDYIGSNLCVLLCLPFFFVGLAVVHTYTAVKKSGFLMLFSFYAVLILLPWLALIVTLLGALEQAVHFRQRLAALPPQSDKRGEDR
ncbi:MAG: DUF2232 domain-containing protein [Alphaproteobacteria bacterium]|nr:DUF2232 domain-containing protein [Alphaproteobacteria bacterium]